MSGFIDESKLNLKNIPEFIDDNNLNNNEYVSCQKL